MQKIQYRLYNPKAKSITTSMDVIIMENNTNSDMTHAVIQEKESKIPRVDVMVEEKENVPDDTLNSSNSETIINPADVTYDDTLNSSNLDEFCDTMSYEEISNDANSTPVKMERRPPARYGYNNIMFNRQYGYV